MMMNIVEQEREFCGKEEEEEEEEGEDDDDEEEEQMIISSTSKLPLISPSSCTTKHTDFQPQSHLNLWTPSSDHSQLQGYRTQESPSSSLNSDKRLDLMDLTLGSENRTFQNTSSSTVTSEREHMFDKVVTPSDVGKLNRLVIPKQHAEKYFPLDSSSNEKGLLLNFEDRNGKPWRFRYSYWNSSQSYVMTKGWSRFVKEKKLDAGDIVSFQRGVGESGKHHLYIDWRRRPNAPDPTSFAQLELQNQLHFSQSSSLRRGTVYSLPHTLSSSMPPPRFPYHQSQFRLLNYGHHQQQYLSATRYGFPADLSRPPVPPPPVHQQQQEGHQGSMVMDSIPMVHGRSVGKRLRLFGVNMECPIQDDNSPDGLPAYLGSQQSRLASSSNASTPTSSQADTHHEFSKKGKTSLSFDLGL